ncbi:MULTISPECIES: extracellular solute-binding protein [Pseudothermotoga]|jgi:multiple sugar transport system substrate-binding protein|uniref:Extracellular solute-binding protein family 1 n=1 Tax=Pseudothermotoga lettingae (strain ATCC BAA-301 / DSM 14385 / NBRC 107922 / TMO) TaxID=416591 RepID=A8F698_PSELT|nr:MULTISPECIES: extracellular solute-binding protein [Pseudothermotoga]ABV33682.1 extracellular solute-binding protein family 1 [Pseudothermotoga lettingae TMO]KUK20716.1 MAG: Extracellular solute-binding protein family 1 [Pseudothermotoga lettingae]MDI3494779.1 multiple sugar transport system substrate-binding protein [Pseudothermotoga sp.]MDK2885376.1 multiple sugar transport system substrate-binding protein [Pseudothermotoga sp.]GLI49400.1 sugar ABC transporter substrate-binding protein [P
MKRAFWVILLVMFFLISVSAKTKIVYWQYYFETKVKAIDELIKEFEKLYPDIEVEHVTFPYETFNEKVAASVPAGTGPDVVNLYYGWIPKYVTSGYLQPLPRDEFNDEYFNQNFFAFVQKGVEFLGEYYALPIAVRSLALFWNKDLFKEAGLDPDRPPKTLHELVEYARKLTKYDKQGNIVQAGMATQPSGQGHHWIREVLVRQFGGAPYSEDYKKVTYQNVPEALKFYTDLITVHKVGYPGFMNDDITAFMSQSAAMNIDGSFRIGALKNAGINFGVAELPEYNGIKSNFASFWANAITKNATGEKLSAAIKFLKFLASEKSMQLWLEKVGELPANPKVAEKYYDDPVYGPFLKGLEYAHATFFVDEKEQRQVIMDAVDKVWLKGISPEEAFKQSAETEQKVLDEFWKGIGK